MKLKDTAKSFLDTNILVYACTEIGPKTNRAIAILSEGGVISVQVLNEFATVTQRKAHISWDHLSYLTSRIKSLCSAVEPLTLQGHEKAVYIAERYKYSIYDANILASALLAGCTTLYSEDMQDGQHIEGLTIRNPFTAELP